MSRLGLALAALLLPTVVGSCGSSGGGSGPDDQARIKALIRQAFTSRDPAACRRLATQRFLEQTEFRRGEKAVRECEEDAKTDEPARSVAVSRVKVDAGRGSARAALRGGDDDGATVDLALVEDQGHWKLDRVTAIELDFERYLRAGRKALGRPPNAMKPKQADCTVRRIRVLGESRLERAIVAGDPSAFMRPIIDCIGGVRALRAKVEEGVRRVLENRASPAQVDCVLERLRETLTDRLLVEAVESGARGALTAEIRAVLREAAAGCMQGRAPLS